MEKKYCDVVMKGGITSGVVYPPAVSELSKTYNFKNIGGASAGAIAAAVTAAAQYRLNRTGTREGFDEIEKLAPLARPGVAGGELKPLLALPARPTKTRDGRRVGKGTRFPVLANPKFRPGRAVRRPHHERERPAFIHPVRDNPLAHFVFDPATSFLAGKTARGKLYVELLDLNREGLEEARKDIYITTGLLLAAAVGAWRGRDLARFLQLLRIINGYRAGEKPYSLAGRKALEDQSELLRELERIQRSLS